MAKKDSRFKVVFREGNSIKDEGQHQIMVDTETGVNYLVWKSGYAGGITPLLDREGRPVISAVVMKD